MFVGPVGFDVHPRTHLKCDDGSAGNCQCLRRRVEPSHSDDDERSATGDCDPSYAAVHLKIEPIPSARLRSAICPLCVPLWKTIRPAMVYSGTSALPHLVLASSFASSASVIARTSR